MSIKKLTLHYTGTILIDRQLWGCTLIIDFFSGFILKAVNQGYD